MRKILLLLLFLTTTFLIWVFFFIPNQLKIEENVLIRSNKNTINRGLNDLVLWKKWWPEDGGNILSYHDAAFHPHLPGLFAYPIDVAYNGTDIKTLLSIVEKSNDSAIISWRSNIRLSNNPFTRIIQYRLVKTLSNDMKSILGTLQNFMSDPQNVYGIKVTNETVKDTLLVNTQAMFDILPTTDNVYALINKLATATQSAGASITGYPMMNIEKRKDSKYLLRVALPVSKLVKEGKGVVIKRMFPGNILVSNDIIGGDAAVENAFKQMMYYVQDYDKTMPAIPFQSLITNRQLEKDSSKWVTRIYCPVI